MHRKPEAQPVSARLRLFAFRRQATSHPAALQTRKSTRIIYSTRWILAHGNSVVNPPAEATCRNGPCARCCRRSGLPERIARTAAGTARPKQISRTAAGANRARRIGTKSAGSEDIVQRETALLSDESQSAGYSGQLSACRSRVLRFNISLTPQNRQIDFVYGIGVHIIGIDIAVIFPYSEKFAVPVRRSLPVFLGGIGIDIGKDRHKLLLGRLHVSDGSAPEGKYQDDAQKRYDKRSHRCCTSHFWYK